MHESSLVLVIRHVPFEHLGLFEDVLMEAGAEVAYHDIGQSIPRDKLDRARGMIVMGGPMSVNDGGAWVDVELDAMRRMVDRERPVLGICLGAQLLAKALGAQVYPNGQKEIGWSEVFLTRAARNDPIFHDLASPLHTFQWHGETFDIPDGAEWLGWTTACSNQAFRYGANAYGLQFHPEVTPEMIEDWCGQDQNCGDVRELRAPLDSRLHEQSERELARTVASRWLALF